MIVFKNKQKKYIDLNMILKLSKSSLKGHVYDDFELNCKIFEVV
jgi:hypothetical protein